MMCQHCNKNVTHRKPCKVLRDQKAREVATQEHDNDVETLRAQIRTLKSENERLKLEIDALQQEPSPPLYTCWRCQQECGYDGYCPCQDAT